MVLLQIPKLLSAELGQLPATLLFGDRNAFKGSDTVG